ncbi:SDR family NAD(P)-dependent oxidoreductase [Pseudochelatococcus sp. B33]
MNVSPLRRGLDNLAGRTVIVTGGGRGLGRAVAQGFAAENCNVLIVGRDRGTLEEAAAAMGSNVLPCPANVANETDVEAVFATARDRFGRVDVLVNNAGINPFYKRAEDTTLAQWQQIIDVNLTGVFLTCKHAGRVMLEQRSGSIVNITSVAARVGLDRTTAYCAAKAGVELLTRQLAVEWADRDVRVNAVGPGYFATDLTEGLRQNERLAGHVIARTPLRRFGAPEELVGACLFLASDAASYVTGHSLMVDGGWTAC